MNFGERLRQCRKGKYSQGELADLLHVHTNTVSRWESGGLEPKKQSTILELAKILGTTRAYLLGDTDDPEPVQQAGIATQEITPSENESISAAETEARPEPAFELAYWAGVVDNARKVAARGRDLNWIVPMLEEACRTVQAAQSRPYGLESKIEAETGEESVALAG